MASTEELQEKTVAELRDLASDQDIDGRSGMNKDELVKALAKDPPEGFAETIGDPVIEDDAPVGRGSVGAFAGDPVTSEELSLSERVSNIESWVIALQARVNALDARTEASSRILGS